MAEINKHSETWEAVTEFLKAERKSAIEALIADTRSEHQRGAIALIDEVLKLAEAPDQPLVGDDYN